MTSKFGILCCGMCIFSWSSAGSGVPRDTPVAEGTANVQDQERQEQQEQPPQPMKSRTMDAMAIHFADDNPEFSADSPTDQRPKVQPNVTRSDLQGKRRVSIWHTAETGIVVEIVRRYGPTDLPQLLNRHPELADFVHLFPDRVGHSQIDLNLDLKTIYRAQTLEELRASNEEAFSLYQRYYRTITRQ